MKLIGPFENLTYDIQAWPATIYIEDELSHKVFCQPPNRFYEALSAGIAIFVDIYAAKTLKQAGLDCPGSWMVHTAQDVLNRLGDAKQIAFDQAGRWSKIDYRENLLTSLDEVLFAEGIR